MDIEKADYLVFGVHKHLWACTFISTCAALNILQLRISYVKRHVRVAYDSESSWTGTIAEWMEENEDNLSPDE
jgi:hypothetical protein